jgi:hypothetical protein
MADAATRNIPDTHAAFSKNHARGKAKLSRQGARALTELMEML